MLVVDDLTVRRVNLFGFSRVVSRADVARLAFPGVYSFAIRGLERRLLLLDTSGRCLLRQRHYYSTDEEAAQLAATLHVRLDTLASGLASASRLRKTIPGAVSWPEAHPYPVMVALILPMLALVSLIVWALNGFK
jgi:hypothetical protein